MRRKKNCTLPFTWMLAAAILSKRSATEISALAEGESEASDTTMRERATAWISCGSRGIQPRRSTDALRKRRAVRDNASKTRRDSSWLDTLLVRIQKRFWPCPEAKTLMSA